MAWVGGKPFVWAEKHAYRQRAGSGKPKVKGLQRKINYPTDEMYKWVKKANAWCTTWFDKEVQKQKWTAQKPEGAR